MQTRKACGQESDANLVRDECNRCRKRKLDSEEEMLAVFMRLCLGLLLEDIADRFEIGLSTASKTVYNMD